MYLETLPHFRLGATLVHLKPLCEPLACVRGENEDGNFDVRGSADVKHNVYSESWSFMGQHTHRSANTHFGQVRSDLFLLVLFTFDDTRWDIWVCVCLGKMYLMFIPLFMDCAIRWIHITFRWSFSRHCMAFKPHSHQTFSGYRSHIWPQAATPIFVFPIKCFYILGNG